MVDDIYESIPPALYHTKEKILVRLMMGREMMTHEESVSLIEFVRGVFSRGELL